MSDAPLLDVRGLRIAFGGEPVVHGIDFSIAPGEKLALVGESGSGKTVSALSLLRLVVNAEVSGQALLNGRDLLVLSERELRGVRGDEVAVIFQEPMTALNPLYTVGNQIGEVLQLKRGLTPRQARGVAGVHRHPRARAARRRLRAPVERRPAPARHDCHGTGQPAKTADRR
jgi:microcin C transport system ATP-binding protein